ncbi:MAG: DNA polymerase III subunit delta [Clostridiales bacterium]|jgi:DNA polymerase-3 subunit delta|nr:DNA polymerase III subunit delta [Clostridiales bacterium]
MLDIIKFIKKQGLKNFYIFYGEENFLKKCYAKKLKGFFLNKKFLDINYNYFDFSKLDKKKNSSIDDIVKCACSPPFFDSFRILVIKNLLESKKNCEEFDNYIHNFLSTNIIIFLEEKIDKKNKVFQSISQIGDVLKINHQTTSELAKWIIKICDREKISISKQSAIDLVKFVGNDMFFLKQEIYKLINYSRDKNTIDFSDIELLTSKNLDNKIFDLVKLVAQKNSKSLEIFDNLIDQNEQPLVILSMIVRQFYLILKIKGLYDKNKTLQEITNILKIQSFIVHDIISQSKIFNTNDLVFILNYLLEIDFEIKIGSINIIHAIRLFIINLMYRFA